MSTTARETLYDRHVRKHWNTEEPIPSERDSFHRDGAPPAGRGYPIQNRDQRLIETRFVAITTLVLIAVLSSAASLGNGFAFDDIPIVANNPRIHGLAGIWHLFGQSYWPPDVVAALYRPITMVAFALEYAAGRGAPLAFHLVNVTLYVAITVLVYEIARRMMPPIGAWFAASVFAVHPVHVDAVANVVGQSELLAALATLSAVLVFMRANVRQRLTPGTVTLIAFLYALGVLAKENGIVLPAILLLADVTLFDGNRRYRARLSNARWLSAVLLAVAGCALAARALVLGRLSGDRPNIVLGALSAPERILTMVGVTWHWARLFFFPATLVPVYAPPYVHIGRGIDGHVLAGVCVIAGFAVLTGFAVRTNKRTLAFALFWVVVALLPVTNLVFVSGILVAERTLFLPSVGVALGAGLAMVYASRWANTCGPRLFVGSIAGALLLTGALRSLAQSRVWRNNDTLLAASIEWSPPNYELAHLYARQLYAQGARAEAEQWMDLAIRLYPNDPALYSDLGGMYEKAGVYAPALSLFTKTLVMEPNFTDARAGLIVCLLHFRRLTEAREQARIGLAKGVDSTSFLRLLVVVDSVEAATHIQQAHPPH